MLLTINDTHLSQMGAAVFMVDHGDLAGDPLFKAEETVSSGYTDVSSAVNWGKYWWGTGIDYMTFRDILIAQYSTNWGALTVAERTTLVKNYVWPTTATLAELDATSTQAERDEFHEALCDRLGAEGSSMCESPNGVHFIINIDDLGVIDTVEIKPETELG